LGKRRRRTSSPPSPTSTRNPVVPKYLNCATFSIIMLVFINNNSHANTVIEMQCRQHTQCTRCDTVFSNLSVFLKQSWCVTQIFKWLQSAMINKWDNYYLLRARDIFLNYITQSGGEDFGSVTKITYLQQQLAARQMA
jgi:hypothetical protein